ncbi:hypothetical protein MSAN_02355100 [Mycena sanguinolenta]|uniref:Uncharacterized protein n=1 Tax=Mycena sanguinolenta TaxID=230812 RepID=A0A8H7CH43_9AGAR|nr:hypothetical protein MSAN_02355100 [Mycena sanguinolenta]
MAPLPDVRLSYGPMLIGVFFNMILYGVFVAQALAYYQRYNRADDAWLRFFVGYLFVLETLNTGFDMGMMYQPLILEYGQQLDYFPTGASRLVSCLSPPFLPPFASHFPLRSLPVPPIRDDPCRSPPRPVPSISSPPPPSPPALYSSLRVAQMLTVCNVVFVSRAAALRGALRFLSFVPPLGFPLASCLAEMEA